MKTGETVDDLGIYSTECCSQEVTFDTGDTFTRCPNCSSLCVWELEDELTPLDHIKGNGDGGDGVAA
jgi:hypothetical protein